MKLLVPALTIYLTLVMTACTPVRVVESDEVSTPPTLVPEIITPTDSSIPDATANAIVSNTALIPPADISTSTAVLEAIIPGQTIPAIVATVIPAAAEATQTESSSVTFPAKEITMADNGRTLVMTPGESFLLNLGMDMYDWSVEVDDQNVLSLELGMVVINGAQGIYRARAPGTAILAAYGNPQCIRSTPPCLMPSVMFRLTLTVQ